MQARNMFLHCWIMTPIKTNDKIAVWASSVKSYISIATIHSQGLGFTTVVNNRCESHKTAYESRSNKICMNE